MGLEEVEERLLEVGLKVIVVGELLLEFDRVWVVNDVVDELVEVFADLIKLEDVAELESKGK